MLDGLTDRPSGRPSRPVDSRQQALNMIADLKKRYALSNSSLARELGLSYSTLMRWKRRFSSGQPAVQKPGPKKLRALNLANSGRKSMTWTWVQTEPWNRPAV